MDLLSSYSLLVRVYRPEYSVMVVRQVVDPINWYTGYAQAIQQALVLSCWSNGTLTEWLRCGTANWPI